MNDWKMKKLQSLGLFNQSNQFTNCVYFFIISFRLSRLSCSLLVHLLLYAVTIVYCIFNHSLINALLMILVYIDVIALQNVEQYAIKHLPFLTKKSNQTEKSRLKRQLSISVDSAYERISLHDEASYSNWISLFPNMSIRSLLYICFCVLLLARHMMNLFTQEVLVSSSLVWHRVIYALNGGLSISSSIYYEVILCILISFLNHVVYWLVFLTRTPILFSNRMTNT